MEHVSVADFPLREEEVERRARAMKQRLNERMKQVNAALLLSRAGVLTTNNTDDVLDRISRAGTLLD